MNLRSYQTRAIERARSARREGNRRILLVSPTGSGKTIIACSMIHKAVSEHACKVLVIAHRQELIDQFYVQLGKFGITPGIMKADDERTDEKCDVQVGTIQTLTRRNLPKADIVFVDESHRVPGESYRRVLECYPKATIFGLTATPQRLDGKPLRDHFDTLIEIAKYSELIDSGDIVAPIIYISKALPNLSKVGKVAGDYNEGQLADASMTVVGDIVENWLEKAERRKTVCFAVNIEHSQEIVAQFLDRGVRAAHLDGKTPKWERYQTLLDLETGKIEVLSNCNVLCEGWDQPSVKCCIMARPTLSLTLWMQCAGRILRPFPGPPPLILDHAGNCDRQGHGAPHEDRAWNLEDGKAQRASSTRFRVCASCYAYVAGSPCPICGAAPAQREREVKRSDGVLERIDANIIAEQLADPKRAFFQSELARARKKGFKPGYVSYSYKQKYNEWPPWKWSELAKAQFECDREWRDRATSRARERDFWQGKSNEKMAVSEPEPLPETANDNDFSGIDEL